MKKNLGLITRLILKILPIVILGTSIWYKSYIMAISSVLMFIGQSIIMKRKKRSVLNSTLVGISKDMNNFCDEYILLLREIKHKELNISDDLKEKISIYINELKNLSEKEIETIDFIEELCSNIRDIMRELDYKVYLDRIKKLDELNELILNQCDIYNEVYDLKPWICL